MSRRKVRASWCWKRCPDCGDTARYSITLLSTLVTCGCGGEKKTCAAPEGRDYIDEQQP